MSGNLNMLDSGWPACHGIRWVFWPLPKKVSNTLGKFFTVIFSHVLW